MKTTNLSIHYNMSSGMVLGANYNFSSAVSMAHALQSGDEVWMAFGTRKSFRYFAAQEIAAGLGTDKVRALPIVVEVNRFWLIMKNNIVFKKQVIMLYEIYSIKNYYYSIINTIIILRLKLYTHGSST